MIKVIEVSKNLYRGPHPETNDDWKYLRDVMGITATLDLESGASISNDNQPIKEQLAGDSFNLRVYCHPLGSVFPPTKSEIENATYAIYRMLVAGHKVYVHCAAGVDRTGLVIAARRIQYEQWNESDAINECWAMGFHWWYFYWMWAFKWRLT